MQIQKRGPQTYYLRWTLPHAPGQRGERKGELFHGTLEAAKARWAERAVEWRAVNPDAPRATTLAQLADLWLAEGRAAELRPATRSLYRTQLRQHVLPGLGATRIDQLTPRHIAAAVAEWRRAGVGARTCQVALDVLRRCLDQAVAWEWLPRNPAARVDRPAYRAADHAVWTLAETRTFLTATREIPTYGVLYRLALLADGRQSEVLGLRWADVRWEPPSLFVHAQFTRARELADLKPGEKGHRWCPLDRETVDLLRGHQRAQAAQRQRLGADWTPGDWVFTTAAGAPLGHRNLVRRFKADAAAAGVPAIRFQDLRATGATLLAEGGTSERLVADRLGHSTTRTTRTHYLRLAAEAQRPHVDRLARAVGPAPAGPPRAPRWRIRRSLGATGDTPGIQAGDPRGYEE